MKGCEGCERMRRSLIELVSSVLEALQDEDLGQAIIERNGAEVCALAAELNAACLDAEISVLKDESDEEAGREQEDEDFFDTHTSIPTS